MKKFLIASGVAVLALASVASAQGYQFSANLTVGSTGPDVVALQTWLVANGYHIPSIESGAAAKGYFGSQTKAAVTQYQAVKGLPSTGFFGPLTRGLLNGGPAMAGSVNTMTCPAGYVCTQVGSPTTSGTVSAPAGITTPGVSGTLTIAQSGSVANGATFNTGQTVNIAGFKLQAGPSDMQVNTITGDFNVRPWLYFSSFSLVNQTTGQVLVPSIPLSQAAFTEITASQDYRLTVSGLGFVVPHGQTVNVVITGQALSGISQTQGTYISLIAASVRSTDGTGVVDTQNVTDPTFVLGSNTASKLGSVLYNGNQTANLVVSIDPTSPNAQVIQTQTGSVTNNVPLATFAIQAQNNTATLQGLTVNIGVNGAAGTTLGNVFNTITLQAGGNTYYGTITPGTAGATGQYGTVTFNSNVSIPLAIGQNTQLKIVANINQGVNGVTASTSLVTPAQVNGLDVSSSNFIGVDTNFNSPTVHSAGTILSAVTTFSTNAAVTVTAGTVGSPTYTATTQANVQGNTAATFPFSFTVAAGTSAVYISANPANAVTINTSLTGTAGPLGTGNASSSMATSISAGATIPGDSNTGLGTNASGAFIVPSNSSRTFTVNAIINNVGNASTATNAIVQIAGVYYASSAAATSATSTESLYTSNLTSLQSPGVSLLRN